MCRCTPSIKSPYCLKCMPTPWARPDEFPVEAIVYREQSFDKIKEIVKTMDGLSEDGFKNRYLNDPSFRKSVDLLVNLTFLEKGSLK